MAEDIIKARVWTKVDTLENWNNNPLLLGPGEMALVTTPSGIPLNMKWGDKNERKRFSDLPFAISYDQGQFVIVDGPGELPTPESDVAYSLVGPGTYTYPGQSDIVVDDGDWGQVVYNDGEWSFIDMGELPGTDINNYSLSGFNLFEFDQYIGRSVPDYISGGVFTDADSSPSGRGFFTETAESGQVYFGWTFPRTTQNQVSGEIYIKGDPQEVRITFYTDAGYIPPTIALPLVREINGVKHYSIRSVNIPSAATRVRLVVYSATPDNRTIEFFKPYIGWGDEITSSVPVDSFRAEKGFTTMQLLQPENVIPSDFVAMKLPPNYRPPGQATIDEEFATLLGMPGYRVSSDDIDFTIGYLFNIFGDLGFTENDESISASIVVKVEGEMPTRVSLGRYTGSGFIDSINLVPKLIYGDDTYLYTYSDLPIPETQERTAIQLLGKQGSAYTIAVPTLTKGGVLTDINAKNLLGVEDSTVDPVVIDENSIADVTSRIRLPFTNGSLDIINGQLVDRVTDLDYFTIWGSSTMHALGAFIQSGIMPLTGATQWFRGTQGGECVSHTSARFGARKLRSTFVAESIPASGSTAITHNLKLHKIEYLKAYTGYFELETGERVYGTVSYSASSPTKLVFTRTTSGTAIPATQIYEFVPDFDEKFLCGYNIINVAKNDTDTPLATGMESEFLRTLEMFTHMKPAMPRCVVLGNFVNNNSSIDDPNRQKWVLDLNRRLKEHFGLLYIDVQEYLMSEEIWVDTSITPTTEDLEFQDKGELAPSLMQDFAHTNATVNERIVNKLIKNKFEELGWI